MQDKFSYYLLKPKYWLSIVGFFLAKLATHLPLSLQIKLGYFIGWLLYNLVPKRRKIAEINLNLCFPELTAEKKAQLLKENFALTGLGLIETAVCWFGNINSRLKQTQIIGKENLDTAIAKNKGVLLLGFHMTSLEIGGTLLAQTYDMSAMYKPSKNKLSEYFMRKGRLRHLNLFTQNDIRPVVKALKNKQIIWYATDQNYANRSSNFSPFFGIQTATITATSKFAKLTDASVVPFIQKRSQDGKSFKLILFPELENFPGETEQQDATRINLFLENYLRENPKDYMWLHQRFRSRPTGEPPIYPKK